MVARFPALESSPRSNYHSLLVHTDPVAPLGWCAGTDLHSLGAPGGRRVLPVLCPPFFHLPQGECRIIGCVCWVPWDPGPVLLELCSWGHLSQREWGTDTSVWSLTDWLSPKCPEACVLQPYTDMGL